MRGVNERDERSPDMGLRQALDVAKVVAHLLEAE